MKVFILVISLIRVDNNYGQRVCNVYSSQVESDISKKVIEVKADSRYQPFFECYEVVLEEPRSVRKVILI